jgi:hypothetical protein
MSKDELLEQLRELVNESDREMAHSKADDLLLEYIGDEEITEAFNSQEMWMA